MAKRLRLICWSVAMLVCWFTAMVGSVKVKAFTESIDLRQERASLSPFRVAQIERLLREDGAAQEIEITLWRQEQALLNENGREASAVVLSVFGEASLVLPGELLSGYYPARGDDNGILLDQLLAHQLFGSHQVAGMPIVLEGREYTVRGVLAGQHGVALVQSNEFDPSGFGAALLTGRPSNAEHIRAFCEQLQLDGTQIDLPALGWLVEWFCRLPLRILLLAGLCQLVRVGKRWKGKELVTYCALSLPLAALFVLFLLHGSELPASMIPSRWSDFSFYAETIHSLFGAVSQALLMPTMRDIMMLTQALQACGWACLSFLCSLPLLQEATR